jgi:ribonuclease HI
MSETLTPDYEAALLAAKSLAEFNKILKKVSKEQPDYRFSPMPLALGAPMTALQQKIVDLNLAAQEAEEKKAAKKIVPTLDGAVLYSDGGTKPNPGHSGWGVHGYLYSEQPAKRGSGNSAVYLTDQGYFLKAGTEVKPPEITPMKYIDGLGSVAFKCSNNAAEVIAMSQGLAHVHQYGLKRVQIFSDSQYAVQGSLYVQGWANNNWTKRDGQMPANVESWQALHAAIQNLKDSNVEVKIDWVRGHNGNHGNMIVDRYATLGRQAAQAGDNYAHFAGTPAEGYWGAPDRHPLLGSKYAYFVSNPAGNEEGEYFLGEHGKVDKKDEKVRRPPWDLFGKMQADNSFAYVKLKTPDEALEVVRKNILRLSDRPDALLLTFMQKLYEPGIYRTLQTFPECALYRLRYDRLDFFVPRSEVLVPEDEELDSEDPSQEDARAEQRSKKGGGHEPLVLEMNPPLIAQRGFDIINLLKGIIIQWKAGNTSHLTATDITSTFYEADAKDQVKLKAEFGPGFTQVKVQAHYDSSPETEQLGTCAQTEIRLVLGVDTPERNALKKIEKLHPKVTLLTWREGHCVRFAAVIECDEGLGIWAGYHSNMKYLKSSSSKPA